MDKVLKKVNSSYLKTFFIVAAMCWYNNISTANITTLIFAILIFQLVKNNFNDENKYQKISKIIATIFSFFTVFGKLDIFFDIGTNKITVIFIMLISLIGWHNLYYIILNLIFVLFDKTNIYCDNQCNRNIVKVFCISLIFCLFAWLPYFLAYFPGILTPDSINQMSQTVGILPYNNHHPWLHTLFIKLIYNFGYSVFNDINLGVATYSIVQMFLMATTFSYFITILYKHKINKRFISCILLFYSLIPYNARYSITMWKDILFAAVIFIFSIILWEVSNYNTEEYKINKLYIVLLLVFGILMSLLRSNGFFAYIITLGAMIYSFKSSRRIMIFIGAITIGMVYIFKGVVMPLYDVKQPDTIESLSIPAQHIARVITDGCELTSNQYNLLNKIVDVDKVPKTYKSYISDPIKNLVREKNNQQFIEENKKEYLLLWVQLGVKYPWKYIRAQIDQTKGYWYPDVQYWVASKKLQQNELGIYRTSKLPNAICSILDKGYDMYLKIPVYGLIWSIGTIVWITIILIGRCFTNKINILPFVPCIAVLLSLIIATPVYAEFRYIYCLFICIPLFIAVAYSPITSKNDI